LRRPEQHPARTPRFVAEYALLRAVAALVRVLPYPAALGLGWALAGLGRVVLAKRMRQCERRLAAVLGDRATPPECRRILRTAWRNVCFGAVELLRAPLLDRAWVERHYEGPGSAKLLERVRSGRGAVLAVPHMGNWELAGMAVRALGVPVFVIARDQKNPLTTAYLNRLRERAGIEAVKIDDRTFLRVVRRVKAGEVLAILPDIRAKTAPLHVRFLGRDAEIARGMALFARGAGVPILPCRVRRIGWTRHAWDIGEPVEPDRSLDRDTDAQRMTQAVMAALETEILAHPDQYFWFNKRWILGPEP
jgi:KDO2-lipid IV(A) lauroyltransferase